MARLDLLHKETEIKSYSDVSERKEEMINQNLPADTSGAVDFPADLPPDMALFEQLIDTIMAYQSKIKRACSILYILNGSADLYKMVEPQKVTGMIKTMQTITNHLQDLDAGFRSMLDDATGKQPLWSIKEIISNRPMTRE